jgi:D-alanyl-D-alanine carboxypeptidase
MPATALLAASCFDGGSFASDLTAPPVPWWSVTKTCLAACALVLVERGRLTLDDPLPDRAYTLRHLLQHTSGLGNYTDRSEYREASCRNAAPWTDTEVLAQVRLDPFLFAPGQGWSYSNTGYFLVRRLIEEAAGTDIGTALRTFVFSPLGIERTRIACEPADLDACAWGNTNGYHPGWVFHGLLVGPPADAAQFMHRLLSGELLSPALQAAMRAARALDVQLQAGRPWRTANYGLGVMIDVASPLGLCIGHTGAGPDSVSAAYHFPELDPPRTVSAFAPVPDQAVAECAVVDIAGRTPFPPD